jgi:hypothetical protein
MKLWFRLTLIGWALLGLFLALTPPAGWNYQDVVSSGPWFDRGKETLPDSTTTSAVESMEFDLARAASLPFLVLDSDLAASNTGPPGDPWAAPNRWVLDELPTKPAAQNNAIESNPPTKLLAFNHQIRKSGFRNRL